MPYLKRINSLPLINHISYKHTQVSDIGPSWSSCSYDAPGVKISSTPGVTSWNYSKKEGGIHFVGKMTRVSDPGPSWPSCLNYFLNFQFVFCPDHNFLTIKAINLKHHTLTEPIRANCSAQKPNLIPS